MKRKILLFSILLRVEGILQGYPIDVQVVEKK